METTTHPEMGVAPDRISGGRDARGTAREAAAGEPGPIHAVDAVRTRDGDPWSGAVVPGAVHFRQAEALAAKQLR